VTAALCGAASIALLTPAATAAPAGHPDRLVATASCQGGGRAKLVSTVDAAGGERATLSASGVPFTHWAGQLVGAEPTDQSTVLQLVARRGNFGTAVTQKGADSVDAYAWFRSRNESGSCTVATGHDGNRYSATGDVSDLVVKTSAGRGLVHANIVRTPHHLYRFVFTEKTSAGVEHWQMSNRADRLGHVGGGTTPRHRNIASFTKVRVTITDRTQHEAPIRLSLAR
jgi:hypothetical protein